MSGISESTAIITGREAFTPAPAPSQNQTVIQAQLDQHIPVYDASYRPEGQPLYQIQGDASVVRPTMNLNVSEQKRKRGRPRKYGPDGSMAPGTVPDLQPITVPMSQEQVFSPPLGGPPADPQTAVDGSVSPAAKKRRGRPPGSVNKKKRTDSMGSTGVGFIPHVIDVKPGEDVASTVMTFSRHGPRTICILSATGVVSSVTLRPAASSCATATYQGSFNILLLSGFYMPSNVNGQISRTGGLSITLAGSDGRVFGGSVAGVLTAESPVQVVVGSFIAEPKKDSEREGLIHQSSSQPKPNLGSGRASASPSQGGFTEYSGPSTGLLSNHPQGIPGMPW